MDKIPSYWRKIRGNALTLLLLCGLILVAMWPWARYFPSGFPRHFDPPFHAWKLQVEAENLLTHHRLVPDTNTNVYYPNANELYFDALLWPQGILAALLKVIGCNPVFTYNLVFLFFWGVSGLFMYLLLRELDLRKLPAFFGASAMCLIPYRISYYVEFNMQMCFGLPLFLFFWVRYDKQPNITNAVGLAVSFWLQAVSELYQAIFLMLSFPLIVSPFIPGIFRKYGRSRRFYVSIVVGLTIAASLCFLYLDPYLTLMQVGYRRSGHEMMRHSLEPLAYLGRIIPQFFLHINAHRIKFDEMNVFPSFTLLSLFLAYGLSKRKIFRSKKNGGEQVWIHLTRWVRFLSIVIFLALIAIVAHLPSSQLANSLLLYGGNGTLILILISSVLLLFPAMPESNIAKICGGLAASAALCFVLSLGPLLRVLSHHALAPNAIFSLINRFFPLNGLRVMSRFSIMVMLFLIVGASCFLNQFFGDKKRLSWIIISVLILSLILEAHRIPRNYEKFYFPISPAALSFIKNHPERSVAVLPLGNRNLDGRYMLAIGGTSTLLINGWGGFIPRLQSKIAHELIRRPRVAFSLINSIWPKPLIVLDRKIIRSLQASGYATTERWVSSRSTLLVNDPFSPVYDFKESPKPEREVTRFVRGDVLRKNSCLTFKAKCADKKEGNQRLFVFLNGTVIGRVFLQETWHTYRIPIPLKGITDLFYEILKFRAPIPRSWMVKEITFQPVTPSVRSSSQDLSELAAKAFYAGNHSRPNYVVSLPKKAKTETTEFSNGIRLVGMRLYPQALTPGQSFEITTFWSCPPLKRRLSLLVIIGLKGPDHTYNLKVSLFLPHVSLLDIASQPVKKIFFDKYRITIPKEFPHGKYQVKVDLIDRTTGKAIKSKILVPNGKLKGEQNTDFLSIQ